MSLYVMYIILYTVPHLYIHIPYRTARNFSEQQISNHLFSLRVSTNVELKEPQKIIYNVLSIRRIKTRIKETYRAEDFFIKMLGHN